MMFDKLKKRFSRKEKIDYVLPSHTEIVDMLYDKHLDFSDETVIKIVYGANNEHRVVILKNSDGYFRYIFERIEEYDADEMMYFRGIPTDFRQNGERSMTDVFRLSVPRKRHGMI